MKISLFKTYADEADVDAVAAVIRRGTYWAIGPEIAEFEKKIAAYVGTKYAVAFNSGTSALHTLLLAYGVEGAEVIVPSFTFISTANAVVLAGGIPVFAESEPETFGLDAADVERRITPRTKAIIPLHYGGFPSRDIEKLRALADKHNLLLIDDAAESLGSSINGKKIGSFGHAAMFSFCQNKALSTGEGGMLVTDDVAVYEKAKLLRSHGRVELAQDYFSSLEDNDYIEPGYNYRMPTMIAALGLSQLKKIDHLIALRRERGHYFTQHLKTVPGVTVPKELPGHFCCYQMYTIRVPNKAIRDGLQQYLAANGIMSKIYFNPAHLKTLYAKRYGYAVGDLPVTEQLSDTTLNIPLHPTLSTAEMDAIVQCITHYMREAQ